MKIQFLALAAAVLLLFSFIACSPKSDKAAASVSEETADDEKLKIVTYNGKPISPLLGNSRNEIIKAMGTPLGTCGTEPPSRLSYDGIHFWFDDDALVRIETFNPSALALGEDTLNKSRAELIKLYGNPAKEFWGDDAGYGPANTYTIIYASNLSHCLISLYFADPDSTPWGADIHKIIR